MKPLPEIVTREHGRLRELMQKLVLHATAAAAGDLEARVQQARAVEELKRALHDHAILEEARLAVRLVPQHLAEEAAAIELRSAVGLEDVKIHVVEIASELDGEELALTSAGDQPAV